jgi:hypothetical protein
VIKLQGWRWGDCLWKYVGYIVLAKLCVIHIKLWHVYSPEVRDRVSISGTECCFYSACADLIGNTGRCKQCTQKKVNLHSWQTCVKLWSLLAFFLVVLFNLWSCNFAQTSITYIEMLSPKWMSAELILFFGEISKVESRYRTATVISFVKRVVNYGWC